MFNLSLQNVSKIYPDGKTALKDVRFEFNKKEFITIVGPSGCGKTTLLRMIAGLESVSSGKIILNSRDISRGKNKNIAMVFQIYGLYPQLTAKENIELYLKIKKINSNNKRNSVEAIVEHLGLKEVLDHRPSQLSGGQRQRVAIAKALVRNPELFLMDEPLSNLDAKLRIEMRELISEIYRSNNACFLYVTHDQSEAMSLSTQVIVMNNGRIQQIDSPKNIYSNPSNTFVATFIGDTPMNLIEATIYGNELMINEEIIQTPEKYESQLSNYKRVILGVRSEDIYLNSEGSLTGTLLHQEIYGDYSLITLQFGDVNFTVRNYILSKEVLDMKDGDKINFTIDLEKLVFFNIQTNERIY